MARRGAAAAETRARIVDATMALHNQQGIAGTSWDDIAKRAGVGVGTVYRHFPSLDELLPACGRIASDVLALPDAGAVFEDVEGRDIARRLVDEVFGIYERGAPIVEELERARGLHPHLAEHHREVRDSIDVLVREAAGRLGAGERDLSAVRALLDVRTWRAFELQGMPAAQTRETVADLVAGRLGL